MKKEIADKWADKLESGEYKQGTGCLREGDKYCCLGVLSDIVKKEIGAEWTKLTADIYSESPRDIYSIKEEKDHLPLEVRQYCEINEHNPSVVIKEGNDYYEYSDEGFIFLSDLNDKGVSFKEIAQLIRENYETI